MKFVSIILLIASFVFAIDEDFKLDFKECAKQVKESFYQVDNKTGIAISKKEVLVYSNTKPSAKHKILREDIKNNLYLVESNKDLIPLDVITNEPQNIILASISKASINEGKQINSDKIFGYFDNKTEENSAVVGICYQLYGLGIGNQKYIKGSYLKEFLTNSSFIKKEEKEANKESPHNKKTAIRTQEYLDLGIRFKSSTSLSVALIDPFFKDNPFMANDKIISLNNKKLSDNRDFFRELSSIGYGKCVNVVFQRNGYFLSADLIIDKKYEYDLFKESFFERFGVAINDNMIVTRRANTIDGVKWLKEGDKILQVNGNIIRNKMDLKANLSFVEDVAKILVERDNFQFFINIKTNRNLH